LNRNVFSEDENELGDLFVRVFRKNKAEKLNVFFEKNIRKKRYFFFALIVYFEDGYELGDLLPCVFHISVTKKFNVFFDIFIRKKTMIFYEKKSK